MWNQKTEFHLFTIPQWKQEEAYLRQQHQAGWKFTRVTGLGLYHFVSCPPEDVVYQLDYPLENQGAEYLQIFSDCGWEYIQTFWGYSYFRKPVSAMNGPEEIFGDDESRLDLIRRVTKRRLLPLFILFLCILPPAWLQSQFPYPANYVLALILWAQVAVYLVLFAWCGYSFWQYWRNYRR